MAWVRAAAEVDVDFIARNMREADRMECAAHGKSPYLALSEGFQCSLPCFTGMVDDRPVVMFGVVPLGDGIGSIWLLGTDAITNEIPVAFLRWTKRLLPVLTEPFTLVCNAVDKRNVVHVKWLRWLGFTFIREVRLGPSDLPFYEFARLTCVTQ
jgi:hypothetical protein